MADYLDWIPLLRETVDSIRARMDADANAGLDPADNEFLDLTPGGFYWDLTQPAVLEIERLYDFLSTEVPAAMLVTFAYGDYLDEHGDVLGVERKDATSASGTVTFTGPVGTIIASGTQVAVPAADTGDEPVTFTTDSSVTIPGSSGTASVDATITAVEVGSAGNVEPGTVTAVLSPLDGSPSVTNAAATSGGSDVEDDDLYRERLLLEYSTATGGGTVADYEKWSLAYPGVGSVTVEPLWAGAGTVRVVIADPDHNPCSGTVVTGLQNELDPVAGQGLGLAPIGATVTVATVSSSTVTVAATITHLSGYTLDGTGGTIATRALIQAAIAAYINGLDPGDDVVLARVEAAPFSVPGVYDVASVLLNGGSTNVAIASLTVATAGTITLS